MVTSKVSLRCLRASIALVVTCLVSLLLPGSSRTALAASVQATHFSVVAPGSASAGASFTFTVTALTAGGVTATNYAGTVQFTATDPTALLPASTTLTNGVGTFSATLATVGTQTITATDTSTPSITGTSNAITVNPGAAVDLALASSTFNSPVGTPVNLRVTIRDAFGDLVPGETVHFTSSDPAAVLPPDSVAATGNDTFVAVLNTPGLQTIQATDTANAALTSAVALTVKDVTTHFSVSAPVGAFVGNSFNFIVTALDASNAAVTDYAGTVHFTATDPTAVLPADATLTNGVGTFSATLATVGTQTITAVDTTTPSIVGTSNGILVALIPTTASVTSSAAPAVFGQPVTLTASVASLSGPPPGGSVVFTVDGTAQPPVALASGSATLAPTDLSVGSHAVLVAYLGDPTHATSTGSMSQVVNQAGTTTSLAVAPSPAVSGQEITLTATVAATAPGVGTPTGVVSFSDGATVLGNGTLNAGVATLLQSFNAGPHAITATYAGETDFTGSTTSSATSLTVTKSATTTTLTSARNPSIVNLSLKLTARVTVDSPGSGTPSGTATFSDNGVLLGSSALDGSGNATLTTSTLAVGTHPITVTYSGDPERSGSTSVPLSQVIKPSGASIDLTTSAEPTPRDAAVTFTATVGAAGTSGTPSGSVTFSDGETLLGTSELVGGEASVTTSTLTGGTHTITAVYSGDASFLGTSATLLQSITPGTTGISLVATPPVTNSGSAVTLIATVTTGAANTTATGQVLFFDGDSFLGSAPLTNGSATFSTSSLTIGEHPLHAIYVGTPDFARARSLDVTVDVRARGLADADAGAPNDAGAGGAADAATTAPVTSGDGGASNGAGYGGTSSPTFDASFPAGAAILGGGASDCGCRTVGSDSGGNLFGLAGMLGFTAACLARRKRSRASRGRDQRAP